MPAIINSDGKRVLYTDGKQILRAAGTGCGCCAGACWLLTHCDGGDNITTDADMAGYADVVRLDDGECYTISTTNECEGAVAVTVADDFEDCEECMAAPCECPETGLSAVYVVTWHAKHVDCDGVTVLIENDFSATVEVGTDCDWYGSALTVPGGVNYGGSAWLYLNDCCWELQIISYSLDPVWSQKCTGQKPTGIYPDGENNQCPAGGWHAYVTNIVVTESP